MIRQTLGPIAKRSSQCRRCLFRQVPAAQPQHELVAVPHHHLSRLSLARLSLPTRRVVSSTTKKTSSASPPVGALRRSSVPEAGSLRQLLRRAAPMVSKDAIRDALPIIGNGAYMVSGGCCTNGWRRFETNDRRFF